jgi:hypothetical protein
MMIVETDVTSYQHGYQRRFGLVMTKFAGTMVGGEHVTGETFSCASLSVVLDCMSTEAS